MICTRIIPTTKCGGSDSKSKRKPLRSASMRPRSILDYPSKVVKDGSNQQPVEDLVVAVQAARPQIVYTHNLADKHDTHVAVALQ